MVDSYEIDGQMTIFDIKEEPKRINIKGLCDDACCPRCNYEFWEHEADAERCPYCGQLVNGWEWWHRLNDEVSI